MNVLNSLYPPIVQDVLPAFIKFSSNQTRKFYFSISSYNSVNDIKNVQVSLTSQSTNASAFDFTKHPTGIKICNLQVDNTVSGDYKYYIEINSSDLTNGSLEIDQFYKMQLRFTKKNSNVPDPPSNFNPESYPIAAWLITYKDYFSEWSSVCLIKCISQPTIYYLPFSTTSGNDQIVGSSTFNLIGNISFEDSNEQEYLKKYRIKIEKFNNPGTYIYDSGDIFANQYNLNEFNYKVSCALENNTYYNILFSYTTNNLYSNEQSFKFKYVQSYNTSTGIHFQIEANNEEGRIQIKIVSSNNSILANNPTFILQRASSLQNFLYWEDFKNIIFNENNYCICYDTSAESGIWYKYRVQKIDSSNNSRTIFAVSDPVITILEHMFLTKAGIQLKLDLNPNISDFKYNVAESQQVTIGSKYPFIKRNGNNYFRSFAISGLISSLSDISMNNIYHSHDSSQNTFPKIYNFTSKEKIYGENNLTLYQNYNQNHNITQYNDFIYEREFRNKVYDFLYANDVKLFRSTTEGNILIKLMGINFQPVTTLGRMLYSFSATAIEIDQANLENYIKYGIESSTITYKQTSISSEISEPVYAIVGTAKVGSARVS